MGSQSVKSKILLLEEAGYGKDWVVENYFQRRLSAEACCKIFKGEAHISFTPRAFKVLLEYYKLEDKSMEKKNSDRNAQQRIAAFNRFKNDCEVKGFTKEWFSKNYSQCSISEIVEILRKKDIKAYKDNVKKLLIEYGIILRSFSESSIRGKVKAKETNILKYGVDNPAKSEIVKEKSKITIVKNLLIGEGAKIEELDNLSLEELLELSGGRFFEANKNRTSPKFTNALYSRPEIEVKNIIEEFGFEEKVDYFHNNRSIFAPLEVDFYLPHLKLAIEVNPFWTHSYSGGFKNISKDYHYNKLEVAFERGIDLLQYFPYEGLSFKSIFTHKINGTSVYTDYNKDEYVVDGNFGEYKNLLSNGYELVEHSFPELIHVTRSGKFYKNANRNTLEVFGAGKLIYRKL